MPYYLSIGVSWEKFMDSCPNDLKPYETAYQVKVNRQDIENWQLGQYLMAAISSALSPQAKYPKKPMFQIAQKKECNSCGESQEEIAVFEMKQRTKALEKSGLKLSPM